jgi:hypothetical protein
MADSGAGSTAATDEKAIARAAKSGYTFDVMQAMRNERCRPMPSSTEHRPWWTESTAALWSRWQRRRRLNRFHLAVTCSEKVHRVKGSGWRVCLQDGRGDGEATTVNLPEEACGSAMAEPSEARESIKANEGSWGELSRSPTLPTQGQAWCRHAASTRRPAPALGQPRTRTGSTF